MTRDEWEKEYGQSIAGTSFLNRDLSIYDCIPSNLPKAKMRHKVNIDPTRWWYVFLFRVLIATWFSDASVSRTYPFDVVNLFHLVLSMNYIHNMNRAIV